MLQQAHDAGITAVPTYVIDRQWAIPGAQDPEVFVQVLRRFAAKARTERDVRRADAATRRRHRVSRRGVRR